MSVEKRCGLWPSLLCAVALAGASGAWAGVPSTLGYQAVLRDAGGALVSGSHSIQICLYPGPSGGSSSWCETHAVTLSGGLLNLRLGSINPLSKVAFDAPLYLGVTIDTGTELAPRQPLDATAFAIRARAEDRRDMAVVDCGAGQTVADALRAGYNDIRVKGTCAEDVLIDRDDVRVSNDPTGGAIQGVNPGAYAVLVDGARRVSLGGLTVSGPGGGVRLYRGASGLLMNLTVENTGGNGVAVEEGSVAQFMNDTVRNNSKSGILISDAGSQATLQGGSVSGNANGVVVANRATVSFAFFARPMIQGGLICGGGFATELLVPPFMDFQMGCDEPIVFALDPILGGFGAVSFAQALRDSDMDGLPNVWEIAADGNPYSLNPGDDRDGDGFPALAEYECSGGYTFASGYGYGAGYGYGYAPASCGDSFAAITPERTLRIAAAQARDLILRRVRAATLN